MGSSAKKKSRIEVEDSDEETYEVEYFKAAKVDDETADWKYLVKWHGYDEATWEPADNLSNCGRLLRSFWSEIGPDDDYHPIGYECYPSEAWIKQERKSFAQDHPGLNSEASTKKVQVKVETEKGKERKERKNKQTKTSIIDKATTSSRSTVSKQDTQSSSSSIQIKKEKGLNREPKLQEQTQGVDSSSDSDVPIMVTMKRALKVKALATSIKSDSSSDADGPSTQGKRKRSKPRIPSTTPVTTSSNNSKKWDLSAPAEMKRVKKKTSLPRLKGSQTPGPSTDQSTASPTSPRCKTQIPHNSTTDSTVFIPGAETKRVNKRASFPRLKEAKPTPGPSTGQSTASPTSPRCKSHIPHNLTTESTVSAPGILERDVKALQSHPQKAPLLHGLSFKKKANAPLKPPPQTKAKVGPAQDPPSIPTTSASDDVVGHPPSIDRRQSRKLPITESEISSHSDTIATQASKRYDVLMPEIPEPLHSYLSAPGLKSPFALWPPIGEEAPCSSPVSRIEGQLLSTLLKGYASTIDKGILGSNLDPTLRVMFVHAECLSPSDSCLKHVKDLPGLSAYRAKNDISFFVYGSSDSINYAGPNTIQEIWSIGGIMTCTPNALLTDPLGVHERVLQVASHEVWACYILPAVIGMAVSIAYSNREDVILKRIACSASKHTLDRRAVEGGVDIVVDDTALVPCTCNGFTYEWLLEAIDNEMISIVGAPPLRPAESRRPKGGSTLCQEGRSRTNEDPEQRYDDLEAASSPTDYDDHLTSWIHELFDNDVRDRSETLDYCVKEFVRLCGNVPEEEWEDVMRREIIENLGRLQISKGFREEFRRFVVITGSEEKGLQTNDGGFEWVTSEMFRFQDFSDIFTDSD
ncbi:hypothetical protein C8R42DRAFT_658619 [Lentinula raphanica]|nr:hypothetical protein C8R42DRAFT_658619 [Lentinula raphanica]